MLVVEFLGRDFTNFIAGIDILMCPEALIHFLYLLGTTKRAMSRYYTSLKPMRVFFFISFIYKGTRYSIHNMFTLKTYNTFYQCIICILRALIKGENDPCDLNEF